MIDLRNAALPSVLTVGGDSFPIDTDFRVWIAWLEALEVEGVARYDIFTAQRPQGEAWIKAALEFAECPSVTPRAASRQGGPRALDFVADGEYLVGSFQSAYGIDLTSCKMHWHRFLALLRCLPSDAKMSEIMDYRTYDKGKAKRKPEAAYAELKRAWALPRKKTYEDAAVIEWQERAFANVKMPD